MKREYKKLWIRLLYIEEDVVTSSSGLDGVSDMDDVGDWGSGW